MSNSYTYYVSTGMISNNRILMDNAEADLNLSEDESWVPGEYSPDKFWVVNGVPTVIPPKDEEFSSFNPSLWVWEANLDAYWAGLRIRRSLLLVSCDWTQVADAPVDRDAWATYRQQLRDLPENTTDPRNPIWPSIPT
tara:strand:+ start:711 stop:1124 length:414 start_codon:yes stop_codon:yes gene_type:complete